MKIETTRLRVSYIDEGSGAPLLLLHPFPFSAEVFRADADVLASTMRVVAPSMRGFGGTSPFDESTPPSIDAMADDVASLALALDVGERFVVAGISMGGYVALSLARRHPSLLRGLVLADSRAEPDSDDARAARNATIARIASGGFASFVDETVRNLVADETFAMHQEVFEQARTLALQGDPRAVVQTLEALRDRPDGRPALSTIAVPTLVIVGERDKVTPPPVVEAMARAIPGARFHVIARAGHLVNLEAPAAFRDALTDFMARL